MMINKEIYKNLETQTLHSKIIEIDYSKLAEYQGLNLLECQMWTKIF